jgi:hypothetical protein
MKSPRGIFVGRCRTQDATPRRMFAEDQLDSLETEAADLERRLAAFLEHVQAANLARPDSREPGYHSRAVAVLSCRCGMLARVRQWLRNDRFLARYCPTEAAQRSARARA